MFRRCRLPEELGRQLNINEGAARVLATLPRRLSGPTVARLMRRFGWTIATLAARAGVTRRRVRQIREDGVEGLAVWDWVELLTRRPVRCP